MCTKMCLRIFLFDYLFCASYTSPHNFQKKMKVLISSMFPPRTFASLCRRHLLRLQSSKTDLLTLHETEQMTTTGTLPITTKLEIIDTALNKKIPVFRVLDLKGNPMPNVTLPKLDKNLAIEMYKTMIREQAVDDIFYNAQRQGRISFYMQNSGEEATHVGCASSLHPEDVIFAQYRELGVLLWRGFTVQEAADQCFANVADTGKGRSMPVHYGSKKHNFQTISSPLTTQLPQAVGAAYALKLRQAKGIAIVFFGEGAASEGDFHAGDYTVLL
jgi:2-oxoisovalerate dehydrogenase E1 component alpha subunit